MNLDKLVAQLTVHEGLKLKPYTDSVGRLTIGVGHNLTDNGLTRQQCFDICKDDVNNAVTFLNANCPWFNDLDEVRQRAIANMTFNLMSKLLEFKGMIAALKVKDWNTAADHLVNSGFGHQTGQRAQDLAKMIRTGQD